MGRKKKEPKAPEVEQPTEYEKRQIIKTVKRWIKNGELTPTQPTTTTLISHSRKKPHKKPEIQMFNFTGTDCPGWEKVRGCEKRARDGIHIYKPSELRLRGVLGYELSDYEVALCNSCAMLQMGRQKTQWTDKYRNSHALTYPQARDERKLAEKELELVLQEECRKADKKLATIEKVYIETYVGESLGWIDKPGWVIAYLDLSKFTKKDLRKFTIVMRKTGVN